MIVFDTFSTASLSLLSLFHVSLPLKDGQICSDLSERPLASSLFIFLQMRRSRMIPHEELWKQLRIEIDLMSFYNWRSLFYAC